MIKIMPATIKDYDDIVAILIEVQMLHAKLRPNIYKETTKVMTKKEFRDAIKEESLFIAKENNIVKGILGIDIYTATHALMHQRKILYIHSIVVKEKYRGKGIGTLLLNYAKKLKEEKEIDTISLHVDDKNKNAVKFYKKFGFKVINHKMEL